MKATARERRPTNVQTHLGRERPHLEWLEDRLQPGSILPGLGFSVLAFVVPTTDEVAGTSQESAVRGIRSPATSGDEQSVRSPALSTTAPSTPDQGEASVLLDATASSHRATTNYARLSSDDWFALSVIRQRARGAAVVASAQRSTTTSPVAAPAPLPSVRAATQVTPAAHPALRPLHALQPIVATPDLALKPLRFETISHTTGGSANGPDPQADLAWSTYVTGTDTTGTGRGVYVDAAGGSYVTGSTDEGTDKVGFVARYDANGRLIYLTRFQAMDPDPGYTFNNTEGHAIAVDDAGNAYVAGKASDVDRNEVDAFAMKVDPFGNINTRYGGGIGGRGVNDDSGNGIAVDRTGQATLVGSLALNGGNADLFAVKFNVAGNFPLYNHFYRFPDYIGSNGLAITLDATGANAYIAGTILAPGGNDNIMVMKLDNTGPGAGTHISYALTASDSGEDALTGIAVNSTGNAYVVGTVTDFGSLKAYFAVVNTAGDDLDTTEIYDNTHAGTAIAIDTGGNSYITGAAPNPSTGLDGALVAKLDLTGAPIEATILNGNGTELGLGIGFRRDAAYLTGSTTSTNLSTDMTPLNGTQDAFLAKINNFQ